MGTKKTAVKKMTAVKKTVAVKKPAAKKSATKKSAKKAAKQVTYKMFFPGRGRPGIEAQGTKHALKQLREWMEVPRYPVTREQFEKVPLFILIRACHDILDWQLTPWVGDENEEQATARNIEFMKKHDDGAAGVVWTYLEKTNRTKAA